jgi:RNA polymerase sigma-70 factor (ECF subfamily)
VRGHHEAGALTDAELVERALAGAEDGFLGLVTRYERPVYNLLVQMLRNPALAEELAQDTFFRAFSRLRTYDSSYRFINWILRIAHNLAVDTLRRRAVTEVSADDPGAPDVAVRVAHASDPDADAGREAERRQLARALDAALARLRPEYRRLVVLRYQEDLSHDDISVITGLPVGTVKSYLHRARAEMAGLLERAGWGRRPGPATAEPGRP